MKTKLTITVDRDLLPRAKRYARAKGVSLSSLIEASLRTLDRTDKPSFSTRWRGALRPAQRRDPRYQMLEKKWL